MISVGGNLRATLAGSGLGVCLTTAVRAAEVYIGISFKTLSKKFSLSDSVGSTLIEFESVFKSPWSGTSLSK